MHMDHSGSRGGATRPSLGSAANRRCARRSRCHSLLNFPSRLLAALVAAMLAIGIVSSALAVEEPDADTVARKKLQQQLMSRKAPERLEALERLRNFPSADMAKLVVTRGLKDRDEQVRRAAEDTLMSAKNNDEVCEFLVEMLGKEGRRKGGLEPLYPVFHVLLASDSPDAEEGLFHYFEKSAATGPNAIVAMSEMAEELGKKALPAEFVQLERIARSKSYDKEFGLQRTVIRAATRYTTKPAVAFLFSQLEKQKGELRGDIIEYLGQLTGEQFGLNTAAWQRWWQEHEKTFEYPARPAPPLIRNVVAGNTPGSYYGIPLYAQRMVFVLDTSASMRGPRIVAAKRDLTKAVDELDDNAYFGLIAFNAGVYTWQKSLVQATAKNKKAAEYWILNQELGLRTASYDALEAALHFDAEAIYFLTDGAPVGGRIDDPAQIVQAIGLLNRVRRESIYSIGIGLGPPGNGPEMFLKTLSAENYGIYRRVDE